ncbi:MAG: hypothetical protein WKF66_06050 [Pedobacter sp.]
MENTNENAHLNIETVTPETENEGLPNDQKHNHRVENEGTKDASDHADANNTPEKQPSAIYEKTNTADEDVSHDEKPASNDEKPASNDDAASKVETVSP